MRIGLDLTPLLPEPTGVDLYLRRLVAELARVDHDGAYTLFVNLEDRSGFAGLPPNFAVKGASLRPRVVRFGFQQVALPPVAAALGLDVLHSPSFFLPLLRGRQRHLLTVHDMTSFTHPDVHTRFRRSRVYRAGIEQSIRRADIISVPSAFVAREIQRVIPALSPERVTVIPYGVGEEFRPAASADAERVRRRLRVPAPYILSVGTIEPRKNLDVLVAAYRRLLDDGDREEHLVLAGRLGWGYSDLLARLREPSLSGRVHVLGYVDSADLPGLYAGASVFVYPSRAEGFGFPPLEAMATGTAVIASDTAALAENLRGAAEFVPVGEPEPLAEALRRLLRDVDARARLRAAGLERASDFRWERTARATLACYRELAER